MKHRREHRLRHRGMIAEVQHPTAGKVSLAGLNLHLSGTPCQIRRPPPLLRQHNAEVYGRWLGLSEAAVEDMKRKGVI